MVLKKRWGRGGECFFLQKNQGGHSTFLKKSFVK